MPRLQQSQIEDQQSQALADRAVVCIQNSDSFKAFQEWLPLDIVFGRSLPAYLAKQMEALRAVAHAAACKSSAELDAAIACIRDATYTVAHCMTMYPPGRSIVRQAEDRAGALRSCEAQLRDLRVALALAAAERVFG
jgi:hypothetical protein